MSIVSEPFEKIIGKGNLIHMQADCKVFHQVKVFDKHGNLKKIISEKAIHRRHWKIAELEAANKRGFSDASARKIQRSSAIEQFEDDELSSLQS